MFPVVSQTIAATPPLLSLKMAYRNPKTGLTRGVSQKKLASEAYRAIGGIARNSIANRAIVGHYPEGQRAHYLVSPDFLRPARCDFPHARKGKRPKFKDKRSAKAVFPFLRGKNRISQGVENRGSLISVPLALRVRLNSPSIFLFFVMLLSVERG